MTDELFVKASGLKNQISILYDLDIALDHMHHITITGNAKEFTTVKMDSDIRDEMVRALHDFAKSKREELKKEFENL